MVTRRIEAAKNQPPVILSAANDLSSFRFLFDRELERRMTTRNCLAAEANRGERISER